MMRWLNAVALILYLSLLVTPQVAASHAPHLTPLADSQLQAINPLTGQLSLTGTHETGDDNDSTLQIAAGKAANSLKLTVSALPPQVVLPPTYAAHPVRAPPLYSFT